MTLVTSPTSISSCVAMASSIVLTLGTSIAAFPRSRLKRLYTEKFGDQEYRDHSQNQGRYGKFLQNKCSQIWAVREKS
ncbi:hypothetical protein PhaeoP128_02936 [Phaeobacter gallaeciensis]|nr:hypothetical protein PhaeoP129_02935 [Phaeobacter gallaeciensis]ATF23652.1 hypothetical protein PhaeoP128_02936 [Phaeobacter gallaeciensis]